MSTTWPYRDRTHPPRERAADLLSRMTLEEKAAQMVGVWQKKADQLGLGWAVLGDKNPSRHDGLPSRAVDGDQGFVVGKNEPTPNPYPHQSLTPNPWLCPYE